MKLSRPGILAGLFLIWPLIASCGGTDPATPVSRVVLVGIESLSAEHVTRMVERGELPHFARLIREGSRSRLSSPDPLQSPMLWATMLTGQHAQKHQMAAEYVEYEGKVVAAPSSMRRVPSIFQVAGENQEAVASIGFPGTWPAELLNGFNLAYGAVPGRLVEAAEHTWEREPADRAAFPESLYQRALGHHTPIERMDRHDTSAFFVLNEDEFEMLYDLPLGSIYKRENPLRDFAITLQRDRAQVALAEDLLGEFPLRLVGLHLELPEALQPVYWRAAYPDHYELAANAYRRYGDAIDACYRELDSLIGRLMEAAGEDAVVCVVGNRGFGNAPAPVTEPGEAPRLLPMVLNESMLLLYGHGIRQGADIGRADVIDVAPTLLTALDLPVGEMMDGRVLESAFTEAFLSTHPRRGTRLYTEDFLLSDERYPSQIEGADG